MKAGGGAVINVTSHLGLMGSMKPAYAATKGGIISFTKTLAAQYVDHGIRALVGTSGYQEVSAGTASGNLASYRINPDTGALTPLSTTAVGQRPAAVLAV